ncbi:MAG: right-handed parallel beta-helix repeat-containing protein [archaeon]
MDTIGAGSDAPDALGFHLVAGADGTPVHGFNLSGAGAEDDAIWVELTSGDTLDDVTVSHNDMTGVVEVDLSGSSTLDGLEIAWNDVSENDVDIDFEGADATLTNARITNNRIEDGVGDVILPSLNQTGASADLLIECNEVINAGSDAIEFQLNDGGEYNIRVLNNTIDGAGDTGIEFLDGPGSDAMIDIRYNEIRNCDAHAIEFDDGGGDLAGVTVTENNIDGNAVGVKNDSSSVLDARNNWWGDATGPGAENNEEDPDTNEPADGDGDTIDSTNDESVRFDPWLESAVDRPQCEQDVESDGVWRSDAGRDTDDSDIRNDTDSERGLFRRYLSRDGTWRGERSHSHRRGRGR